MINEFFSLVDQDVGRSLYADDGALWIRGRNVSFVKRKVQAAVGQVEGWTKQQGFKQSVAKTQVICFSRQNKITPILIKLYEQLEQVKTIRFLGVWFYQKLTWNTHITKVQNKCKNVINILCCLAGQKWGASR